MNMGVKTGKDSRIIVLDVDGPEGEESLAELEAKYDQFPPTLTTITGRGRHLYFNHPGRYVKSNAGVLGWKLDVRGDGGYVLVPPSMHISGQQYRWEDEGAEISEAPAWLVALIRGDTVVESSRDKAESHTGIEQGERDNTLFKLGCGMRGTGVSHEEIEAELGQINEQLCQPPLPAADIKRISASAAKYKPGSGNAAPAITGDNNSLRWFPFDTVAWRRNHHIFAMKPEHVGWYIWIIVECWDRGGFLPNDPALLAKLARSSSTAKFAKKMHLVLAEFEVSDDESQLVHHGLRAEYETRTAAVEKRRQAGQKRWHKPGTQDAPNAS